MSAGTMGFICEWGVQQLFKCDHRHTDTGIGLDDESMTTVRDITLRDATVTTGSMSRIQQIVVSRYSGQRWLCTHLLH